MTDIQPTDTLAPQPWMLSAPVTAIIKALEADGAPARFVGGCVRDAILERPVRDIDVATPETPESAMRLLEAAGIRVIPTGIKHGTVTAVADGQPVEVTTLRVDAETDGRWANVEFTEDWQEDAARRDFTMNALYCGSDGAIFDPFGGLKDLKAGRVCFIGDPAARLAEDYLRLLRFFRFYAWYGKGEADADGLAACAAAAPKLATLSGERVWAELSRLLIAPDPVPAARLMTENGIFSDLLPEKREVDSEILKANSVTIARVEFDEDVLANMCVAEADAGVEADAIRRFAAWLPNDLNPNRCGPSAKLLDEIADRMVLSNRERARLENMHFPPWRPKVTVDIADNRRRLYWLGDGAAFTDLALFGWAMSGEDADSWRALVELPEKNPPPEFPIGGDDVMALGVEAGPRVGDLLTELESWWVYRDFEPDRAALLARLGELAGT